MRLFDLEPLGSDDDRRICSQCRREVAVVELQQYRVGGGRLRVLTTCRTCSRASIRRRRAADASGLTARMLLEQDGRCRICAVALTAGKGRTGVALDHDHDTGAIRGLLCNRCNMGLGLFDDDPERLLAAVRYVDE